MEVELKKTHGREEHIRHHTDRDIRELHRSKGFEWRSNRTKLRVIAVTDTFRNQYDNIFRK